MIQQDRFSFFSVKMLVEESLVLQKKGCGRVDRKKKYRRLLLWFLCLDLLAVVWFGYRYLERKIPDELFVSEGKEEQVKNVLDFPFLSFDDAITVSGDGSYLLKARILGVIPFKDVKITPADSESVMVSGDTVGIYMETDGVLVIDTGEIVSQEGFTQEPDGSWTELNATHHEITQCPIAEGQKVIIVIGEQPDEEMIKKYLKA